MATTQNEHNGNGTLRRFSFTFPYIKEDDVKVSVRTSNDDVTTLASTAYTFPSATEIQLNAVTETDFQESTGAPKTGVTLRVFRETDIDNPKAVFYPGSSVRAQDLNDNTLQNLYAEQERQNRAVDRIAGSTMQGNLTMQQSDIIFEGDTIDNFETTLTVVDPTADRTITLPNVTGTVVTTGDTQTITSAMITDGTIVDADINASAEIAVSKLANGTARQLLQTDAAGTGVEFTSNVDIPGTLDVTGATTFDGTVTAGTFTGNLTGDVTGDVTGDLTGDVTGNVTGNVTGDVTGNVTGDVTGNVTGDLTGNADTATTLANTRTIAGNNFNGSQNVTISLNQLSDVNVGTPGSGQDDQVLAWDNANSEFSLTTVSTGGGGGISDIVDDNTPQLGGNLDVQSNEINTSTTDGNIQLAPNGTGVVEIRGNTNAGSITLNCESNSHGVTIRGPAHSAGATYTLTLPVNDGDADQFLQTDGSGVTSWQTVDTTGASSNVVALNNATTTDGFTIAANRNVAMLGPLTVNSGQTITVGSGSKFVILN